MSLALYLSWANSKRFTLAIQIVALFLLFQHSANSTEHRRILRVAVVDTGLDLTDPRFTKHLCSTGHKDFTGTGLTDTFQHGTHVAGLIVANAGDNVPYCLMILKYYRFLDRGEVTQAHEIEAFQWAADHGADLVNFSASGKGYSAEEERVISSHPKTLFIVAAGNEHKDVSNPKEAFYPANLRLKNVIVVGSMSGSGSYSSFSNYGPRVDVWEMGEHVRSTISNGRTACMDGTSQATAIHTGRVIASGLYPR